MSALIVKYVIYAVFMIGTWIILTKDKRKGLLFGCLATIFLIISDFLITKFF